MRGSLLAVIAVAVVLGLGVVALVRAMGWLAPPPPAAVQPVVTAPVVVPPRPTVVVPLIHLYTGDTPDGTILTVRGIRDDEMKDYDANRAQYLASPTAAAFRYLARDVVADTPLKKGDFEDVRKPDPLNARLAPGTRAVDLAIPKELAAGGLIATGDWVDVLIVTDVARSDAPAKVPQAGVLVQSAPVVAKRSTLYSVFAPPRDGPIGHMLAVNPYRAALLEYARTVGTLSLVPVSSAEKRRLDGLTNKGGAIPFALSNSPEYRDEMERIEKYNRGELSVGRADLARVLQLAPPAPRTPSVQIEIFRGTTRGGTATFEPPGAPPVEYVFSAPAAPAAPATPRPAPKN